MDIEARVAAFIELCAHDIHEAFPGDLFPLFDFIGNGYLVCNIS
jgi:hypothetical protein